MVKERSFCIPFTTLLAHRLLLLYQWENRLHTKMTELFAKLLDKIQVLCTNYYKHGSQTDENWTTSLIQRYSLFRGQNIYEKCKNCPAGPSGFQRVRQVLRQFDKAKLIILFVVMKISAKIIEQLLSSRQAIILELLMLCHIVEI